MRAVFDRLSMRMEICARHRAIKLMWADRHKPCAKATIKEHIKAIHFLRASLEGWS